jgi:NAD+ diphosphatase
MIFEPTIIPPIAIPDNAWWFIFDDNNRLVCRNEGIVKKIRNPFDDGIIAGESHFVGVLDGCNCYCALLGKDSSLTAGLELRELRGLYGQIDKGMYRAAERAMQIVNWDRTHRFCSLCGAETVTNRGEYAKQCPRCNSLYYPRISPAIIVAIVKDHSLLLARRTGAQYYSVIAGYVDAGESLEECVLREVREEISLDVKNIRYFGSQTWPYSNSLMIAFTAEWAGGEIKADGKEIEEAGWYRADALPPVPGPLSVARKLIDWFSENFK